LQTLIYQQTSLTRSNGDSQYENLEMIDHIREITRLQARQTLSLVVERLTRFFEDIRPGSGNHNTVLNEQVNRIYMLPRLGLQLTDLLLEQLTSRQDVNNRDLNLMTTQPATNNEQESMTIESSTSVNEIQLSTTVRDNLPETISDNISVNAG
jgi:hypothetical protein